MEPLDEYERVSVTVTENWQSPGYAREDFADRRVDVAPLARAGRNRPCKFTDGCLESEKRR